MQIITLKNKIIAGIYTYLNYEEYKNKPNKTKQDFIKYLTLNISNISTGYAGFRTKHYLQTSLLSKIFGFNTRIAKKHILFTQFPIKEIVSHIESTLKKSYTLLPSRGITRIFIFPTFRLFVKEKMFGVDGITPYLNVINMYLYPKPQEPKSFFQEINNTTAHEYNHTIRFQYFPLSSSTTLLDNLINEGLAENFRMAILRGKISPWAGALQLKEVERIFKKIKPFLRSTNLKNFHKIFFANKEYPLWSGYAIGYQIVKSFLKNNKKIEWEKIIQLKAKEILKRSEF